VTKNKNTIPHITIDYELTQESIIFNYKMTDKYGPNWIDKPILWKKFMGLIKYNFEVI